MSQLTKLLPLIRGRKKNYGTLRWRIVRVEILLGRSMGVHHCLSMYQWDGIQGVCSIFLRVDRS
jgi:hypothetical protein